MGAGIVILFWLFVAGVLALIWVALVVAALVGWKRKITWLKWAAGLPAAFMLCIGLLVGALIIYAVIESSQPESVFKAAFGKAPPPSVKIVESSSFGFADTGCIYLKLALEKDEFLALVPSDLTLRTLEQIKDEVPIELSSAPPDWWTFQYSPGWLYYLRDHSGQQQPGKNGFYAETEYFAYDPVSKTAYYHFSGID